MPTPFSRSLRSLSTEGPRGVWIGLLAAIVVLVPLCAWFFLARVAVIEASDSARLEAQALAHPVESPVAGEIVANHLVVGDNVSAGDVLVELNAQAFRLQLAEQQADLTGIEGQLKAARLEVAAQESVIDETQEAGRLALAEAEARRTEAQALASYARQHATEVANLQKVQAASQSEARLADAEAQQREAGAKAAAIAVERMQQDHRATQAEQSARLESLRREVQRLEGEYETTKGRIERLKYDVESRRLRAPVAGRIGEAAQLPVGSFIEEGDLLGSIIPDSELAVVARFRPAALGHIRAGQRGELRLDGFPWSQYGSIGVEVTRVSSEVRDGLVRVDLAVRSRPGSNIPLEHGLPGRVEIVTERASPATLVLRAVGRRLTGQSDASAGSERAGAAS